MKHRAQFIWLLCLLGLAMTGTAQIPFGKKQIPPVTNNKEALTLSLYSKDAGAIPYITYDTVIHQFVRRGPGQPSSIPDANSKTISGTSARGAQNSQSIFHLTKDINTLSESFPGNNPVNLIYSFAVLNDVSYFFADDGIHGRELWRSDGTAGGTYMLKDINPDGGSGDGNIIAANGLLYFSAFTPDNGTEPWVSDGSEGGTHILKDLIPGQGSSNANQFVKADNDVYFVASQFGNSEQIWKTDGTEANTYMVKDLIQSGIGFNIFELTSVNSQAFFVAYNFGTGYQLFTSDGTEWGTYEVRDIGYNYSETTAPLQLTAYNNKLYFSADDGSGRRLWESDGTYLGTFSEPSNNGVLLQQEFLSISHNNPFSILNNALYLAGYVPDGTGAGLYSFNASNADGVVLVKDLTDVSDFPFDDVQDYITPTDFTLVNNQLFFKVISSFNGLHDEIWITDGQADHTQMVKSFVQGDASYNYHNGGGLLYFVLGNDPLIGNELWRSDGTGDGTYLVKDINPGKSSSFPDDLTFLKGSLLFRAQDFDNGSELWLSNGNGDGTKLLKDINTTTTDNSDAGFMFKGIGVSGNGILFNAFTPKLGGELYKSDGTSAGTVLLNDIATGVDWSYPNNYLSKNKLTYFIADDATGTAIYRTDGTPGGLKRVTAYINRPVYFVVNYNVNDNGLVFYTLGNRSTGALELWRSNGTDAGTFLLTPNLSYYYSNYVEVIGKTVFFVAGDVNTGYELWKSDGTIAGTKMVKDINPGFNGSDPYSFFVYNGTLYFGAYDGQGLGHNSFWKTDGTEKGTVKVKNIEPTFYNPYFNTEPQHVFCVSGGSLYMTATDYNAYGNELWTTNGTEKGTTLVKDINPFGGSFPTNLTDVKGTLFFTAYDGSRGTLLWSTNGTDKSTRLVSDFTGYGANLTSLCSAGGKLYFLNNSFYPTKLWTSDGTAANTKEVTDDGLTALSNYSELTAVGDKLFFGAYSYLYGTEMYAADVTNNKFSAMMVQVPDKLQELPLNFNADVYPNPAHSKATLQLDGEIKNARISIADMYGKKVWQTDLRNEKTIDLPVGTLPAGVYMITIKSEKGARTLRLVKE